MLFDVIIPKEGKVKLIIAGSTGFKDHILLTNETDKFIRSIGVTNVEVLSSNENGASIIGKYYANHFNHDCTILEADWVKNGKSAEYDRDVELVEMADACIVFWDGLDKTTLNLINICKRNNLKLKIIEYDKGN